MAQAFEFNFHGLVGPTHNYAGLSFGNVASFSHSKKVSSPKKVCKTAEGRRV
jgi:succinylarginine dihydrolase